MSKKEIIERANQALLAAEVNGFLETEKALRSFLAELEKEIRDGRSASKHLALCT